MPDILIRGLTQETLDRLKEQAKRNGRSLQKEAKRLLESATSNEDLRAMLDKWRRRFAGRQVTDSVDLIREDRER